jgi:amidase
VTALNRLPALELARLVRDRAVSPVEVLDAHLAAIERFNPRINAIVTLAAERARADARAAEAAVMRGEPLGPLHGVPVGIKDETPTAGIRTTWGSMLHADHVPTEDAEVVTRLVRAGCILLGKTNTPEFAAGGNTVNRVFGATRNPWNPALSAGGSTGGGAAALATGLVALAEGSDFGGSLRIPAAFCGVVGLRPTPGLVPRVPNALPWHEQNVNGPMARTAEDLAAMLDAQSGPSRRSPASRPAPWRSALEIVAAVRDARGLRIAYCADLGGVGVEREIETACRAAAFALRDAGAGVEEVEFDPSGAREAFTTLRALAMVGTHFERLDRLDVLNDNLAGNIRAGLAVHATDVAAAEAQRLAIWRRFERLFARFDLLLAPTVPVAPFPVEQNYPAEIAGRRIENYIDWVASTFIPSLCTLPAASVPAGRSRAGLPIGLQIVGAQLSEPTLLACAKLVAHANPVGWPPD